MEDGKINMEIIIIQMENLMKSPMMLAKKLSVTSHGVMKMKTNLKKSLGPRLKYKINLRTSQSSHKFKRP